MNAKREKTNEIGKVKLNKKSFTPWYSKKENKCNWTGPFRQCVFHIVPGIGGNVGRRGMDHPSFLYGEDRGSSTWQV